MDVGKCSEGSIMGIPKIAFCSECNGQAFQITDEYVLCLKCQKAYPFNFICEGVCETKADDLVILINEGY